MDKIEAYVDGSFNPTTRKAGYGLVVLKNGEVLGMTYGEVTHHVGSRQVGGECAGAMRAIRTCALNNFTKVHIYYDYEGVEKWVTEEWRAGKPVSKEYKQFMKMMTTKYNIEIVWHKVKAHSGDKYNELADILAKQGCGIVKVG